MLRDYQQEIYDAIKECLRHRKNPCAVLPCRAGKSWIMKEICDAAERKGSKVLILAHRHLLLKQHREIIGNARIASVFTEAKHLGENGPVNLIIVDEGHLSEAESYKKVCAHYACPTILFTATAKRLDNKPLTLCDEIINGISGDELIDLGYVAPYDLYAPKLSIDLSGVRMSGSDFNQSDLSQAMMERKVYGDIVANYRKLAGGMQAIAYCAGVEHSKSIRDLFLANGIPAKHIDASTPEKVRDEVMAEFSAGKFRVLCNCNLISEGITLPDCDCCMLLRPTQSETLYIQQSCRCLTMRPGKRAVVIDFVGNCYAHGTPTEPREYSLTESVRVRNPSRQPEVTVRECQGCFRVYKGTDPICPYCGWDNGKTKKQIEADEKAELERVEELNRKKARMQVGMAKDYGALVAIAKERGYKRPDLWALHILKARKAKK